MPYILRHPTQQPVQTISEPTYDEKYKGWRFDGQLLIDKDKEYTVEAGELPPPPPPPPPVWEWIVDPYYFFNRMGAAADDVFSSSDKTVVGPVQKLKLMWYIDLKDPNIATILNAISVKVAALTPAIIANMLNVKAAEHENVVARRIFFS